MDKSFVLLDKGNNVQKIANAIVKFNFENRDYLVYSIEESQQNSQIFVSKLILNSEGKYFIDNILPEEKNKLNNIVYNIVILIPTDAQKGNSFESLSNNLLDKFAVKLSAGIPVMDTQEYFSNCSVAITSKLLVEAAIKLYYENLNSDSNSADVLVPTWTAPSDVTQPVETTVVNNVDSTASIDHLASASIHVQEPINVSNLNSQTVPNLNLQSISSNSDGVSNVNISDVTSEHVTSDFDAQPNPQVEKLAIVSDPSLSMAGVRVQQPNVGKLKKAGFASTKYIVIGTVCLVLAIIVVVVAYVLINNMK